MADSPFADTASEKPTALRQRNQFRRFSRMLPSFRRRTRAHRMRGMIRSLALLAFVTLGLTACGGNAPADNEGATANAAMPARSFDPPVPKNLPDIVPIRIETTAGTIVVALDHKHAPITTTNFVRYVDDHRFDGTSFYRASRNKWAPKQGFIQGGIAHGARLMLPPIRLEPTSETGLRHVDGTISMA